jgi:hypothetical protein
VSHKRFLCFWCFEDGARLIYPFSVVGIDKSFFPPTTMSCEGRYGLRPLVSFIFTIASRTRLGSTLHSLAYVY